MPAGVFEALAAGALLLHLLFVAWVALGGLLVRRRRTATRVHLASLAYGLVIQIGPWPCPLTLAEQHFLSRAGRTPYETGFLLHYLDRLVYPDVPHSWLIALTVVVCAANVAIHVRAWKRRAALRLRFSSAAGLDSHRPHQA